VGKTKNDEFDIGEGIKPTVPDADTAAPSHSSSENMCFFDDALTREENKP
jgi:hypothetical protein